MAAVGGNGQKCEAWYRMEASEYAMIAHFDDAGSGQYTLSGEFIGGPSPKERMSI
jgi:hypothetical protein